MKGVCGPFNDGATDSKYYIVIVVAQVSLNMAKSHTTSGTCTVSSYAIKIPCCPLQSLLLNLHN